MHLIECEDTFNGGGELTWAREKRVINNIETPYINATNKNQPFNIMVTQQQEGTRTDYNQGTMYPSTGVNSITPADGSTQKGQSGPSETAKKMIVPADNTRVVKPIPFR